VVPAATSSLIQKQVPLADSAAAEKTPAAPFTETSFWVVESTLLAT
jgi:hypothetical protein